MRKSLLFAACAIFIIPLAFSGCARQTTTGGLGGGGATGADGLKHVPSDGPAPITKDKDRTKAQQRAQLEGLGDVYFDFDRYGIREDSRKALENNARLMKNKPGMVVNIEGHCDERGTVEYNLALGEKRAKAVKRYLMNLGIDSKRIGTVSYGEEKPFCRESSESCWQKNRVGKFLLR